MQDIGVVSFGIGIVWYKCLDIMMWYCLDWYNMGQAWDCHWQCVLLQAGDGSGVDGVDGNGGGGECGDQKTICQIILRATHLNSRPGSTGEVSALHTVPSMCTVCAHFEHSMPSMADEYGR